MPKLIKTGLIFLLALSGYGCRSGEPAPPQANLQTPAPQTAETDDSVQKVERVQQQGFDFVYIFRRRDGAALDSEDRKYLRANSPVETNQWVVSDDGKSAIAGSNYIFPPESLEALGKRFLVEDLSKPKQEQKQANSNTSTNIDR